MPLKRSTFLLTFLGFSSTCSWSPSAGFSLPFLGFGPGLPLGALGSLGGLGALGGLGGLGTLGGLGSLGSLG